MAEPKTRPTDADVGAWLAALPAARRADCHALVALMRNATGATPVLWGTSIVGFGRCALPYADGRTQDWPLIAFSPRAKDLTVYLMDGTARHAGALARLGPHRTGATCLYLKSLDGLDAATLSAVIDASACAMRAAHPVVTGTEARRSAPAPAMQPTTTPASKTASAQRGAAKTAVSTRATAQHTTAQQADERAPKRAAKKAAKHAVKHATKRAATPTAQRTTTGTASRSSPADAVAGKAPRGAAARTRSAASSRGATSVPTSRAPAARSTAARQSSARKSTTR
ncbi:MAG: hypothetical protein MUC68_02775 [Burkholderiaceae bacterium]|jgi:hypothetical protein|nr:hypothetical protein [Burkholderiaceae bacterium]